jgi:hypothetical protein
MLRLRVPKEDIKRHNILLGRSSMGELHIGNIKKDFDDDAYQAAELQNETCKHRPTTLLWTTRRCMYP